MRRAGIIALTFLVAASVFFESWSAAADAAKAGGRPHPALWPTSLEAFIAILVLVYWEARSQGRNAPGARVLLLLTTAVASLIQALDAPRTALGITTAVWTPIALQLTVEFATWLLYGKAEASAATSPAAEPAGTGAVPDARASGPVPAPPVGERAADGGGAVPGPLPRPAATPWPAATGALPKKHLNALDRAEGDPGALRRIMAERGIDAAQLPPRHAAILNGHGAT